MQSIYAASHPDDGLRLNSSSGGVFTYLAEQVIEKGGVVFGASFDENWEVYHTYAEKLSDLVAFRGSKYTQSRMGKSFSLVLSFLKAGRWVLFSGTPCQIAGLRNFLHKDYERLICVDSLCHGVPSPKVWRNYLQELIQTKQWGVDVKCITEVKFRSKRRGWMHPGMEISSAKGTMYSPSESNSYYIAFNRNITLRPICFQCPFKKGHSGSDLTMGNFWGIEKVDASLCDEKGVSILILHKEGITDWSGLMMRRVDMQCLPETYSHSSQRNMNRSVLFGKLDHTCHVTQLMDRCARPTQIQRVMNKIYRMIHKITR